MRRLAALALCVCLLCVPVRGSEDAVTRGEFLVLLWQSAGGVPYDVTAHPFADLQSRDDLAQAAGWAYDLGLTKGVGDGLLAPERPLTREECAVILRRWDKLWGRDTWLPDGAAACNDYEGISFWADDSLYWACIMGRMDWKDCVLAPLEPVTQAEAEGYCALYSTSFSSSSQV